MKAAKDLFKSDDTRITSYEKRPLLKILANRSYHSPEISETDDEGPTSVINVYDLSWRSEEVIINFDFDFFF
jgi:hypothetical protein